MYTFQASANKGRERKLGTREKRRMSESQKKKMVDDGERKA